MAVVINEFEAVAEPAQERGGESKSDAPPKIEPAMLRTPLRRLVARHARLRAY